jgi:hypothetical protein
MPLYGYCCSAGHCFDRVVPIADRHLPIPCEGNCSDGQRCRLEAHRIEICHARPSTMLDYGLGANRDAAREGRYDPNRPSTRGVRKVQI